MALGMRKEGRQKLTNLYDKYSGTTDQGQRDRIQSRAGYVANRYGVKKNPFDNQPADTIPAISDGLTTTEEQPVDNTAATNAKILFPDFQGNYDYYADQGQARLGKIASSTGLRNSSANINRNRDFLTELAAKSASDKNNFMNLRGDRLERLNENESQRLEREKKSRYDNIMRYLEYQQANLPTDLLYKAAGDKGSMISDIYGKKAANTANGYQRYSAPSVSTPGFIPPAASGPDNSQLELMKLLQGGGSNYGGAIADILGGLF